MKKIKNFLTISLQIYICLSICASLNAQNMEFFVDSMMNSNEGYEMYEYYMDQPLELTDSTEKVLFAWSMVEHYYTHMFYTMHHSHVFDQHCDSLKSDMCYNNLFELSEPHDDFLEGFRLYTGRSYGSITETCSHDHNILMNLPLPENSLPDSSGYEFDLNPDNNLFTLNWKVFNINTSYDRIEMYLPDAGNDWHLDDISRNPPTGNRSIRLNNFRNGSHSNTMERTFIVGPEDSLLTFYIALVMEDPGHRYWEQPYFKALLLDDQDDVIEELCWTAGSSESGMEAIVINGNQTISYLDWSCYEFNVSNHQGQKVTLRFVASGCTLSEHFGYGYVADICIPCGESPEWEDEDGGCYEPCEPVYCPEEFPLVYCKVLSVDTSLYYIDSVYAQVSHDNVVYATLDPIFYYTDTSIVVCFEISEELYDSLPRQGYDIYPFAIITNKESNFTSTMRGSSFVPNSPTDRNNDFYVTCCPELVLDFIDICEPEYIDLCGRVILDSCDIDLIDFKIEFFTSDSTSVLVYPEWDSTGIFCYKLLDSLMSEWDSICIKAIVELVYFDSIVGDTLSAYEEFVNLNGECLMDEECCPDEDPVQFTVNRLLCLTGSDYSNATFDIAGGMHLGNLPDGYSYCGVKPEFNGGHIDFIQFSVGPSLIQFSGVLHITDTSQLIHNSSTNQYCLTGSLIVCDEHEQECEIDIIICFSTSQPDMCSGMDGLMCMNFFVNTVPYFPPNNPPIVIGDDVWLPLRLAVPFVDKYVGESDTCNINQYWFQVFGIDQSGASNPPVLLHQSTVQQQNDETTGLFQQQLYIPIVDWNSFTDIEVVFWNNCGDTCSARLIPVVPIGEGERIVIEKEDEEKSEIQAYPIPFSSEVILKYRLQNENTMYRVFDPSGKIIATGTLNDKQGEQIIDTHKWISGWYILEVKDNKLMERVMVLVKE